MLFLRYKLLRQFEQGLVVNVTDFFCNDLSSETYYREYSLEGFSRFFLAVVVGFDMSRD